MDPIPGRMMNKFTFYFTPNALTIAGFSVLLLAQPTTHAASASEIAGLADMTRSSTQRIAVQQAIIALASEGTDIDGDGFVETSAMLPGTGAPVGGGFIPTTSAAPKTDSYGVRLGYCAWDNGSTNASTNRITGNPSAPGAPVLAVISAGVDNVFTTKCADIAAGTGAAGDDFVVSYATTQIQQGNSGTLYFGDPVTSLSVLQGLNQATLKDGQLRLTKDTNALYRWNASTAIWVPVGGSGSGMPWLTENNTTWYSNNAVAIGTKSPLSMFHVHAGVLGAAAGNIVEIVNSSYTSSNFHMLRTLAYRFANGGNWDSSSTRIQSKIDITDMGYVEFNPAGAPGGIAFGTGMANNNPGGVPERMRISHEGRIGVNVATPYAGLAVNLTGQIGPANQYPYDIGAGTIGAGKSIYSYGTICIGNSSHDCSGSNGLVANHGGLTIAPGTSYPTSLTQSNWGSLRVGTANGWLDIGSQNSGFAHFITDRGLFFFNRELQAEGALRVYGSNTYLTASVGAIAGSRILTEQARAQSLFSTNVYGYDFWSAALQVREYNYEAHTSSDLARAPRIALHWGATAAVQLRLDPDAVLSVINQNGNDYASLRAANIFGWGFYNHSDARFKRDITPLSDALSTIANLTGYHYYFDHKSHPTRSMPEGRQVGFIAQEVERYIPELVSTAADGYKSVNYAQMTALLLQGIKEQQAILQHFTKKDESTLSLSMKAIEGNEARFKRIETEKLSVAQLEADTARIRKLKADQIDVERISLVKSGEAEVFVSAGSFQPIFNPPQGAQYMVNAFAEDGSVAIASVTALGSKVIVTPISSTGIDVQAWGNQVGLMAENKAVKTTWIRTH